VTNTHHHVSFVAPDFPSVYLDATYLHVRNQPGKGGQVVSMAVVVATAIAADGSREVLGLDVGGASHEGRLWLSPARPPSPTAASRTRGY